MVEPEDLKFDASGLVPAVVQDAGTGEVLMLAYADAEAVRRTLESGTTWFWSRSRNEPWNKGATSGNVQNVVEVRYDCDADAVLYLVRAAGPACHTGERTCFYRTLGSPRRGQGGTSEAPWLKDPNQLGTPGTTGSDRLGDR